MRSFWLGDKYCLFNWNLSNVPGRSKRGETQINLLLKHCILSSYAELGTLAEPMLTYTRQGKKFFPHKTMFIQLLWNELSFPGKGNILRTHYQRSKVRIVSIMKKSEFKCLYCRIHSFSSFNSVTRYTWLYYLVQSSTIVGLWSEFLL